MWFVGSAGRGVLSTGVLWESKAGVTMLGGREEFGKEMDLGRANATVFPWPCLWPCEGSYELLGRENSHSLWGGTQHLCQRTGLGIWSPDFWLQTCHNSP